MQSGVVRAFFGIALSVLAFLPGVARAADVQHIVAKGHTLEAIANRYHVSSKAILEANHMTAADARHLKVGEVLTIPKVDEKTAAKAKADGSKADKAADKKGKKEPVTYVAKPKTPGVVHVKRIATTEEADVRILDRHGKVQPEALKRFEKLMRSAGGQAHPIEPRLLALLTTVSNHFGSRKIEIISGFRPYTPTQYNPHSNHNHGKAIDFRVVGVPNEVLRDFCRTLKNTGCGYYPNSVFVHMDARASSAFWIDYARPGEPPRYNAPNLDADEGASDVHGDALPTPPGDSDPTVVTPGTVQADPEAAAPAPSSAPSPAPVAPSPAPRPEDAPLPPAPTTPLESTF